VNLDFKSAVPSALKHAVAAEHFRRAKRLSSTEELQNRSNRKIEHLLEANNYPARTINKAKEAGQREPKNNEARRKKWKESVKLKLPYHTDKLHRAVTKIIQQEKLPITVVYEHSRNLADKLTRSALSPTECTVTAKKQQENQGRRRRGRPRSDCITCKSGLNPTDCDKTNAIYTMKCKLCKDDYIGESKRRVDQARNKVANKPWGQHVLLKHPTLKLQCGETLFEDIRVIAVEPRHSRRRLREAVEIRHRKPAINLNAGWQLMA